MFIIVFWLGSGRPSRLIFFVPASLFFHTHAFLLMSFVCFCVLFKTCGSHARKFGKTVAQEFPISYSRTELYHIFSRNDMIEMVKESPDKKWL